jgi:phosphoadenosine phosphosulfate reductase
MNNFQPQIEEIAAQLVIFKSKGLRVFATSSFQTNSVVLLHIIHRLAPEIPIYVLNTGFLFPETLLFQKRLASQWALDVRSLRSSTPRINQRSNDGRFLFASDPDTCCHLNKVAPLEPVLSSNDVWINGIRASQSNTRRNMAKLHPTEGILRYHPLLEWNAQMIYEYIEVHSLPKHPLEEEGFVSIGCRPCTARWSESMDGRGGRWAGLKKTECGLHTTLGS